MAFNIRRLGGRSYPQNIAENNAKILWHFSVRIEQNSGSQSTMLIVDENQEFGEEPENTDKYMYICIAL